jgi:hypothetical protein
LKIIMLMKIYPRFKSIWTFYYEGFRDMSSWGKKVWTIIIIKLIIMFAILRILFFPDFLKSKFDNDKQRGEYVMDQLLNKSGTND